MEERHAIVTVGSFTVTAGERPHIATEIQQPDWQCKHPGCPNTRRIDSDFCKGHHRKRARAMRCSTPGCRREGSVGGKCSTCYQRLLRNGTTAPIMPQRNPRVTYLKPTCRVTGCQNLSHAKGLCKAHYGRLWRGQPLDGMKKRAPNATQPSADQATDAQIAEARHLYALAGTLECRMRWRNRLRQLEASRLPSSVQ